MPKMKTLNELAHLKESRFGRPEPRHGLKLLYWFANDCLSLNHYGMFSECDPTSRDFGFHPFENRYDSNGVKLLPDVDSSYYVVGNLNSAGADELPDYVREDYTGLMDDSNMDRIIVSLDDDMFDRVYVTEHDSRIHYNPNATYRISKGLLQIISDLELEDFLRKTGYWGPSDYIFQGVLISYDPQPVNTNVASVTPKVNPPKNQDCRIEIDSAFGSECYFNDWTTTGYSSRRRKCCECTIL
ncbi:uncharacterized protein LOC118816569 [Colossoma macropomum]|uniref:uncharacterized protein LOC118816569 n=1 Tax=Colossoma macropomum TaxID=42526 RepID=UPI001863B478|nr:uncharacterized protein LOC118816569 [Colossoma macropomum]